MLTSCADKMEYHEYVNYDADYVKKTFGDVGGLISDIYLGMDVDFGNYSGAILGSASDESEYAYTGNAITDFYNGAWSPTNAKESMWNSCYKQIANCNRYLTEFTGLTFPDLVLTPAYQQQMYRYNNYQYEVRFLKAYFYFNLTRQYGDVPFVEEGMSNDEINTLSRTPSEEIFEFIISECEVIQDLIIEDYEDLGDLALPSEPAETGRIDRLTVLALKARAALYAASPLFNPSNDQQLWHRAATFTKELIEACEDRKMKLVEDYSLLWTAKNYEDAGEEIIFGRRANTLTNSFERYNFPAGLENCSGGNCPTQTLVDAYEMQATGLPPETGSGSVEENPYYEGRDPRFALTIAVNGDTWPNWNTTPLQTYQGGANGEPLSGGTPTGYYLKKYCQGTLITATSGSSTAYHTWITFRLGEFYLNYAEAVLNWLGDPYATDDEFTMTAAEALNKTRVRAGMPTVPAGLSNETFMEKYKNERMVELAFEGHRFWDVRRWKEGAKYFSSIDEMKITLNADGTYTYTRQTVQRQWDDKMYFFPIPQSERAKNPNLTQNPGW
ncbi:MAG: RagB/SusD family nutrient uptake outer membrane protein [Bacteroides sp.]|nr:RagB/SusD family nutrient uptake outer membrane protein [Bacteroides sp.]